MAKVLMRFTRGGKRKSMAEPYRGCSKRSDWPPGW